MCQNETEWCLCQIGNRHTKIDVITDKRTVCEFSHSFVNVVRKIGSSLTYISVMFWMRIIGDSISSRRHSVVVYVAALCRNGLANNAYRIITLFSLNMCMKLTLSTLCKHILQTCFTSQPFCFK